MHVQGVYIQIIPASKSEPGEHEGLKHPLENPKHTIFDTHSLQQHVPWASQPGKTRYCDTILAHVLRSVEIMIADCKVDSDLPSELKRLKDSFKPKIILTLVF